MTTPQELERAVVERDGLRMRVARLEADLAEARERNAVLADLALCKGIDVAAYHADMQRLRAELEDLS